MFLLHCAIFFTTKSPIWLSPFLNLERFKWKKINLLRCLIYGWKILAFWSMKESHLSPLSQHFIQSLRKKKKIANGANFRISSINLNWMLSILTRAVGRRVLESIDFKIHESSDLRAGSLFLNDRYDDDGSVWLWIPACCCTMGFKKIEVAFALAFLKNCTKGQLISKANFEVFIWTKKRMKIFLYFCPGL